MSDGPRDWRQGPPFSHPIIELVPAPDDGVYSPSKRPVRPRYGLALFLFALTFFCTTTLGPLMLLETGLDIPWLSPANILRVWRSTELLRMGLAFSIPALTILFAHEMGHYLACRRYRIPCTLPYFLPVPINFGTFGAFIKITAPIQSKRQLFDVGVAGPIAGFVTLLPFLAYGIAKSEVVPASTAPGETLVLGPSLAIDLAIRIFHGGMGDGTTLNLHPVALAAWLGLFATALNLLPLGQLDGGHILYAATGRLQRRLALPLWLVLALLGFLWPGWWLWCVVVLLIGLYHPPVYDESEPLGAKRRLVAWVALLIFVLSFIPVPLRTVLVR
jgi:membrane-associated protease RseP (regulator of RpoE activity)